MNKEFYCLYQYLKKEGFSIDLDEFELQILTHPEYPSLLSVTDALSFFNVENGAFNMGISGIDSLPNRFMTVLQDKNGEKGYHLIEEKNDENHICYSNKNKIRISKKELESRWGGVVILIENPELQAWSVFKKIQVKLWNKRSNGKKAIDNYEVLKDALLISNVLENNLSQSSTIHLGNINASLKIMMVINPFSSACKESYFVLEKILEKHFDKVCLDIRFNFNNNDYGYKKSKKIHQQLVAFYLDKGQEVFTKELHNWFEYKDEKKLCESTISQSNEIKSDEILNAQFHSNSENEIIFTPTIAINNYMFPKQYDLKELGFFINEISEDNDFKNKEKIASFA